MIPCPNGCGRQMPELRLHIDGTNGVCGRCNNARVSANLAGTDVLHKRRRKTMLSRIKKG
jgi:hypothetical protein